MIYLTIFVSFLLFEGRPKFLSCIPFVENNQVIKKTKKNSHHSYCFTNISKTNKWKYSKCKNMFLIFLKQRKPAKADFVLRPSLTFLQPFSQSQKHPYHHHPYLHLVHPHLSITIIIILTLFCRLTILQSLSLKGISP